MTNVCLNFKIEEYKLNLNRLIEGSLLVSKVLNTQWATKRLFINQQRLKWRWKLEFLCLWTSSVMKVRLSHIKCWHLSISYFKSVIYMLGLNFILIACIQAYKCVTTIRSHQKNDKKFHIVRATYKRWTPLFHNKFSHFQNLKIDVFCNYNNKNIKTNYYWWNI